MFIRKLIPSAPDALCSGGHSCPDVLELESGDFAVIGSDITEMAMGKFPPGSGCGPNERVVRIPRNLLVRAKAHIPNAV